MIKKGMLGAVLAIATLLIFSGAANAEYGGPSTVTVVQGETISVTGDGCNPGATVTFTITNGSYEVGAGTTTAGDDGSYTSTITVPSDAPVGTATATATCDGPDGTVTKVLNLNITAAAAPVSSGTLPRTGSDNTQTLVGVGAGFLLLGGTLAIGARRTRRSTVAA
ncbi:LPXTG cell wall anchor domain-containing protein [Aquihabitans sp. G128]|uniref:LPXTG cell wall anchor domain-containing protein n=1 Tax=Aquihabitans sp. G128 TaxID=2849779 RepID=UPI001C234180|nr:LPXTG cell wall anchor domain-containing protein [Aquihabitans sp. G128]QXC60397.1 LPXTG cell wall anchor domain-containing protein [Aquihabitans sp. G128]